MKIHEEDCFPGIEQLRKEWAEAYPPPPTTWTDAFGRTFTVGDRVMYSRSHGGGGGYIYVVGTVLGPAKTGGDTWVTVRLTDNTFAMLQRMTAHELELYTRRRPVQQIVPSVGAGSLVLMDSDFDVQAQEETK